MFLSGIIDMDLVEFSTRVTSVSIHTTISFLFVLKKYYPLRLKEGKARKGFFQDSW